MNNHQTTSSIENRFLSLVGVTAFCYFIVWASPITFISHLFSLEQSYFFLQFERHFWQFLFAFIAVIVLSRGHLWSYGINSQSLKTSMIWLSGLYIISICFTFISLIMGNEILPADHSVILNRDQHLVIEMLVYWMTSPVANQILFFSFGQTILMKQLGDSLKIAGIPIVVLISALLFTFGATTSQFSIGLYSPIPTFFLGLFCGIVYWKTNSLITPMLGQAFYFGFPLFVHFLRLAMLQ